MKLKTNKTVAKRVKVTKNGKVIKRKGGQDHFNSRERSNTTRNKRRDLSVFSTYAATIKALI